ncbi:MAG: Gfo/Idh/MocA family oxidoreductase [Candidatus Omnitrophica bacterium]|nr:Gfo/Idh/MocA family oxidoreductase [Candidatus Omnitrophota bacterium]
MKILVIGCGSIGQRHIKNLVLIKAGKIAAFDINRQKLREVQRISPAIKVAPALNGLWKDNPRVVFICAPTALHVKYALIAAKKGCHLFIEKPLSNKASKQVNELVKTVSNKKLITFIGYNYRFNDCIIKLKRLLRNRHIGRIIGGRTHVGSYLPQRHPWEDYRVGYGASRSLGGGVIVDVLSHHIDYLTDLFGRPRKVFCCFDKRSALDIDVEDTAELLLEFSGGLVISVHGDSIQRPHKHTIELIGERGTIFCDLVYGALKYYNAGEKRWVAYQGAKDYNLFYIREIRYFIECVKKHITAAPDIREGKDQLRILSKARQAGREGRWVKI